MSTRVVATTTLVVLALLSLELQPNNWQPQNKLMNEIPKSQPALTVTETSDYNSNYNLPSCIWSPKPVNGTYIGTSCMNVLKKAILASATNELLPPQRWMFFGDSTIARLFTRSPLKDHFVDAVRVNKACPELLQCQTIKHHKCNLDLKFNLTRVADWKPPDFALGEGPAKFGLTHPYCQDCNGCNSYYTRCHLITKSLLPLPSTLPNDCLTSAYHGFYWSVEFARDVELQSPHFGTTQENLLDFIQTNINLPNLQQTLGGKPICLISMGLHDMKIPNITMDRFAHNAQWFLQQLAYQCSHIVWLPNAAPLQTRIGGYPQTQETIGRCNEAVANLLPNIQGGVVATTSLLDVWDSSIGWPHDRENKDNLHMNNEWYHALGSFLVELSKELIPTVPQQ